jgi:hypothetical protein
VLAVWTPVTQGSEQLSQSCIISTPLTHLSTSSLIYLPHDKFNIFYTIAQTPD